MILKIRKQERDAITNYKALVTLLLMPTQG